MRAPIVPSTELTQAEAIEELTGLDVVAISQHCGARIADMDEMLVPWAVVWAYENRDGKKRPWADVKRMTKREIDGYFTPEEAREPGEPGKDATTTGASPNGASSPDSRPLSMTD